MAPGGDPQEQTDRAQELVRHLGGHPATALGLDLDDETDLGRWLAAACLLAARSGEPVALAAFRALRGAHLTAPAELARASPEQIASALAQASYPKPEVAARRLWRAAGSLLAGYRGSPAALARQAECAEELAARVAALAPGIGAATAAAFLRPLRDAFPAAREIPLSPAARAAALHLGLLRAGEDEEGEPGALRAALGSGTPLADAEAALERLGRRACLRERADRCPLGDACPARARLARERAVGLPVD